MRRGGQVLLHRLADVRQTTIEPIIAGIVAAGSLIHTDEHAIHARLRRRGQGTRPSATDAANTRDEAVASTRCASAP